MSTSERSSGPPTRTSRAGSDRRGRLDDHAAAGEDSSTWGTTRRSQRKIDEALLAWQLEDQLTKEQILTKYLNTVYFGQGAYGIQAAARSYFGDRRQGPDAVAVRTAGRA